MSYRHQIPTRLHADQKEGGGTYSRITLENQAARTRSVFYLLGVLAFFGWLYVVFASDAFVIRQVEANGLEVLDPVDVNREVFSILDARPVWRPWPARHAWFVDRDRLSEVLVEHLFAERVMVDKTRGNVLRLKIEERANRLVLHSHQQFFWVDLQGIALRELNSKERQDVTDRLTGKTLTGSLKDAPVIHYDLNEPLAENFHVVDAAQVKGWVKAASDVRRTGIEYREIQPPLEASSTSGIILSKEGFPVLIDYYADLKPQLGAFRALQKSGKPIGGVKEYIDVRVPGYIYIK